MLLNLKITLIAHQGNYTINACTCTAVASIYRLAYLYYCTAAVLYMYTGTCMTACSYLMTYCMASVCAY